MNEVKLNNVIKVNDKFLTDMTFKGLKSLIDWNVIKLDLSAEVPYLPLEDGNEIHLNIDSNFIKYDCDTKELIIKDNFLVADGAIRLINFVRDFESNYPNLNDSVTLNISCYDASRFRELFNNTTL